MRIDAHMHVWQLAPNIWGGDYGWLTPDLDVLYADHMPDGAEPLLAAGRMDGAVLVQAAPTVAETEFLLGLADEYTFVKGVVGWVDFDEPNQAVADLRRLAQHSAFKGVRPMIQDIEDVNWMLNPVHAPVFEAIIELGLTFDALVKPPHLANLKTLLARYPAMRVVIDHGAKPDIAGGGFDEWAAPMAELAAGTRAYCKFSGLLTEAGESPTQEAIKPYADHLLKVFGPDRLIFGSDYPVLKLAGDYAGWLAMAEDLAGPSESIFGGNAVAAYKL